MDSDKETEDADPFVVALAVVLNRSAPRSMFGARGPCVVVNEESSRPGRRRIPAACAAFGVRSIRHLDMFATEGWAF